MENKINEKVENKKSSNKNRVLIFLFIISLLGISYLMYQNINLFQKIEWFEKQNKEIKKEKGKVVLELEEMIERYEVLEQNNDSMSVELLTERAKVEKLLADAKQNRITIFKLQREANSLRKIMKGYLKTIDSLNTLNIDLQVKNIKMNKELETKEIEITKLSEEQEQLKEKIRIAGALALDDIIVEQQKVRGSRQRSTTRASKVNKIKICFQVIENRISEPGNKILYIRIIAPGNKILNKNKNDVFKYEGKEITYSVKKEIYYQNNSLDICTYFDVKTKLKSGLYNVEIYSKGIIVGNTRFNLK